MDAQHPGKLHQNHGRLAVDHRSFSQGHFGYPHRDDGGDRGDDDRVNQTSIQDECEVVPRDL